MKKVSELENYVLFVFKNESGETIISTTDNKLLENIIYGNKIKTNSTLIINNKKYIVKNIEISKIDDKQKSLKKYGVSIKRVTPKSENKNILFIINVIVEQQLA